MQRRLARLFGRIGISLLLLGLLSGCSSTQPYKETSGKRGWHLIIHAAKKNPTDQYAYAKMLQDSGQTRRAARQYLALTIYWPESKLAGDAQYRYAQIVDKKGKLLDAFDEYDRLFRRYTGYFPYDKVLERQFEIATNIMTRKKGKFLFFPGFSAPERAIPLFSSIITNGPQWEKAAECEYLIGQANEKGLEYESAIEAYMTTQYRYPDSPFAEKAAFSSAYCFYLLTKESPNNEQFLENAWAALTMFLNSYPNSMSASQATRYREELLKKRAQLAYNKAYYYDVIAKKPQSALIAYETFVQQFPHSEWSDPARARIDALKQIAEKSHEK